MRSSRVRRNSRWSFLESLFASLLAAALVGATGWAVSRGLLNSARDRWVPAVSVANIRRYQSLGISFVGQVDVRVYDCSPPCSIHAVDVSLDSPEGSIFVENYLPHLEWIERPCILIRSYHSTFPTYAAQCLSWFNQAKAYSSQDSVDNDRPSGA